MSLAFDLGFSYFCFSLSLSHSLEVPRINVFSTLLKAWLLHLCLLWEPKPRELSTHFSYTYPGGSSPKIAKFISHSYQIHVWFPSFWRCACDLSTLIFQIIDFAQLTNKHSLWLQPIINYKLSQSSKKWYQVSVLFPPWKNNIYVNRSIIHVISVYIYIFAYA